MFSYNIQVRKINKPGLKIKAVASIIIDDIMSIDGFKIIEGSKGLFVSVPNHKGTIMEDGVKVEKYFDDVRFLGEEGNTFSQELKTAIMEAYNSSGSNEDHTQQRASAAAAHKKAAAKPKPKAETSTDDTEDEPKSTKPDRTRKPIWNFS